MMFSSFFHMQENPFGETPDPHYFYEAKAHRSILCRVTENILAGKGFSFVSGEVGSGKTLIIRQLNSDFEEAAHTAVLLNPLIDSEHLLREILVEFGFLNIKQAASLDYHRQLQILNHCLVQAALHNKRCILFVDEAQLLSQASFEVLRLLTNLETNKEKLLQIVVFAQPEMKERLKGQDFRQLLQRISLIAELNPLTKEETEAYILHRLDINGAANFVRFEPRAIKTIYKHSQGLPRLINSLCEKALALAEHRQTRSINKSIINEAKGYFSPALASQSYLSTREVHL